MLILSRNASLYSTSRIVLAARARGHNVTVIDPLDFQIVVARGKPGLYVGGDRIGRFDVIIPRIGASITSYGLAVVRQFELMGVPVLNEAIAIARSRDKLRALQLLARQRIDVPTTVCARNPAGLDAALLLVRGCPAIVKLQQGTQGIGTMIADTPQSAHALLETFWAMGQDIVLQEYVKESKGRRAHHRGRRQGRRIDEAHRAEGRVSGELAPRRARPSRDHSTAVQSNRHSRGRRDGARGRRRRHARRQKGAPHSGDQQLPRSRRHRAHNWCRRRWGHGAARRGLRETTRPIEEA